MTMNRIALLIVLLHLSGFCFSQSLFNFTSYSIETNPKKKATIALELLKYYNRHHLDSLNVLGIDLKKSNLSARDPYIKATYQRILGMFDVRKGFMQEGLQLLESSRSLFVNLGDDELICEAFNETGICLLLMNDFERAKNNFNTSIEFGKVCEVNSYAYLATINLAQCYYEDGDRAKAELLTNSYIQQAIKENKYESIANAFSFLGQIALDEKNIELALKHFEKQMDNARRSASPYVLIRAKNNLAITHFYQGEKEAALALFLEVLTDRLKQGVIPYICDAYLNLGEIFIELGEIKKGAAYLDSALALTKKHELTSHRIEALEMKMKSDASLNHENEVSILRQKQIKLTKKQRAGRNIRSAIDAEQSERLNWPWYIYFVFILIPIVLYLTLKKNLSN